jgi:hypothetical protein
VTRGATGAAEARRGKRESARAARRANWESLFAPWAAAAAGAAISASFLFQRGLAVRAAMFVVFFAAALLAGKRVSIPATVLVSASIVAANLLVPVGRVVAQLGPFRITETALLDGLGKALLFEGLVCVSKASILPGLRLPGRLGALVAASFVYYDRIVEYKGSLRPATLIADVDRLMLSMWVETESRSEPGASAPAADGPAAAESGREASGPTAPGGSVRGGMKPLSAAALVAAVAASYLPFLLKL